MRELDYSFGQAPWEVLLGSRKEGDTLQAGNLLAILEGESAETAEEAFQAVEDRGVLLDISGLPKYQSGSQTGERLRREAHLAQVGFVPQDLEPEDPLRIYLEELACMRASGDEKRLALDAAAGDESAQARLLNLGLARVVELAREYAGYGVLMLDLIQEGNLGLWQGIQVYHTGDYPALRDRRIRCAMAKAVTLQARSGGVGEKLRKAMQDYCEMDKQLLNELGRNPTVAEIAGRLNMTLEEGESVSSMLADAVMMQKQEKPREEPEESSESVEDTAYFRMRERVAELLSQLDSQDAELLTLRFGLEKGEPLTPEATAARLGLSTREVLDREAKALGLLRNAEK